MLKMIVNSAESLLVKLPKRKPARHVRQILQKPRRVSRENVKKDVIQFRVRRSRLQSNMPRRDLVEISTPRGNGRSGTSYRATKEMSNLRSYAKAQTGFRYQNDPQSGVIRELYSSTAICVRNIDIHVLQFTS